MSFWKDFFLGSPEKHKRVSTLLPEQEAGYNQLQSSLSGPGAGGAFGSSADYFYNILNDNPELMNQFMAPEMQKFQQEIVPGLSEQFAGMGSGGLSSSGFRNSAVRAGSDLAERLASLRAGLKQNAAQGLMNQGQMGLGNYSQDVMTQQASKGILPELIGQVPAMAAAYFTGGASLPKTNSLNPPMGNSSPYGGSPTNQFNSGNQYGLPNFMGR